MLVRWCSKPFVCPVLALEQDIPNVWKIIKFGHTNLDEPRVGMSCSGARTRHANWMKTPKHTFLGTTRKNYIQNICFSIFTQFVCPVPVLEQDILPGHTQVGMSEFYDFPCINAAALRRIQPIAFSVYEVGAPTPELVYAYAQSLTW